MTRQCVTCPALLTEAQQRNGTRRCQACRIARPGQLYSHRPHPGGGTPYFGRPFGTLTTGPRATCTESWWVGLDRAALQARAAQRHRGGNHDVF